jgi:hypothetical protein
MALLYSYPYQPPEDFSMLSTTFAFPTNEIRSAMIATGSLAGAIKQMFYDEAMVDLPDEMLRSLHAQIATNLMYVFIEGRYLINPFSFEMEKINDLISKTSDTRTFSFTWISCAAPLNFVFGKFIGTSLTAAQMLKG